MAYTKKIWKDYPDTTTPTNAEALNNIEDELETLTNGLETVTTGLETLTNNLEDGLETLTNNLEVKVVLNEETPTNEFMDGKRIYIRRIRGTLQGTGISQIPCVMVGNYTPLDFTANFDTGSAIFQGNTPRSTGTAVANTQLCAWWEYVNDKLTVASSGFDRTGTVVMAKLFYTKD